MISRTTTTTTNVLEKFKWKKFKLFLIFILLLQNTLFGMEGNDNEKKNEGNDTENRLLMIEKEKPMSYLEAMLRNKDLTHNVFFKFLNVFDLMKMNKLKKCVYVTKEYWQKNRVSDLKELFAGDFEAFMDGALDSDLSYLELKIPFTAIDELQSFKLRFTKHVGMTIQHDKHSFDEEYAQGKIHVHCNINDSEKEYANKALFYPEHAKEGLSIQDERSPFFSSLNKCFDVPTNEGEKNLILKFRIETDKEDARKSETGKKQIKVEILGRIFPLYSHKIEFRTLNEEELLLSGYGHGKLEECPNHSRGFHEFWGSRNRGEEREIKEIVTQAEKAGIKFKFYFDKDDFEVWDRIHELRSKLYAPEFQDQQHDINLELQNILYKNMKNKVENLDNYVGQFLSPEYYDELPFPLFPDIKCSAAVNKILEDEYYKHFYQQKYEVQLWGNVMHRHDNMPGEVPYPNIPTLESFIAEQKIAENELCQQYYRQFYQNQLYQEQLHRNSLYPNQIHHNQYNPHQDYQNSFDQPTFKYPHHNSQNEHNPYQIHPNPYNANQTHQNPYNPNQYYQNSFDQDTFNYPNQIHQNQYNPNQIHQNPYNANQIYQNPYNPHQDYQNSLDQATLNYPHQIHHNQYNPNQDDQNSFDQPTLNYPNQIYQNQHIPNQDYQ